MKEELIEKLSVFKDFKFFEEDHHYEFKGKRVGISVTRLIEEYCNEFDSQNIAGMVTEKNYKEQQNILNNPFSDYEEIKYAKQLKTQVTEILKEWDYKNKFACSKGHNGHNFAQSLWSREKYIEEAFDDSEAYIHALEKIKGQARQFYEDYKDTLEHLVDEFVIGSEEFDLASAIDHLLINKLTRGLVLLDYKTNSILKGYNDEGKNKRYIKPMKVPLQNIDDITIEHYYIQLSIYKYLLEKYANVEVEEMFIVYFSENIDNYEIIEVPYLKKEVELILENRRVKNMNSVPILLIGKSGSGKSTSLRNFTKDEVAVINVLGKPLPFKSDIKAPKIDDYANIINQIKLTKKNVIVIDDANYLITNEFIEKTSIKGYDKYNEMAKGFFDLINAIKNIDGGKTVYLIMHEDTDDDGNIKPKTIGKLLDDKVNIQGMFTVCIRSVFENGQYIFKLKTNGQDCVKTPFGMFNQDSIENDLKAFDKVVREYYELDKVENKESEEK